MTTEVPAACVIGWPAKHSRSPKLHGYWLERYGIAGAYRIEEVAPENFAAFVRSLPARGYVGANVTIPHKEAALGLAEPDDRARAVGAANTLFRRDGRLHATNTDVEGFLGSLDAASPGWADRTRRAVVLGAGGAARAIVFGLIERGIQRIDVANRTEAKAAELRDRFGSSVVPHGWDAIPSLLPGADLLVNTTSLGMTGQPPLVLDVTALPAHAVISDIVYVPLETALLAAARARGLPTADGLQMLIHQAVRGFELWFGVRPEATAELYDRLAADIRGR